MLYDKISKLINSDSIAKIIYEQLRADDANNKTYKNWATQVRTILETHGFANIWANHSLDKYTLEIIKTRITLVL